MNSKNYSTREEYHIGLELENKCFTMTIKVLNSAIEVMEEKPIEDILKSSKYKLLREVVDLKNYTNNNKRLDVGDAVGVFTKYYYDYYNKDKKDKKDEKGKRGNDGYDKRMMLITNNVNTKEWEDIDGKQFNATSVRTNLRNGRAELAETADQLRDDRNKYHGHPDNDATEDASDFVLPPLHELRRWPIHIIDFIDAFIKQIEDVNKYVEGYSLKYKGIFDKYKEDVNRFIDEAHFDVSKEEHIDYDFKGEKYSISSNPGCMFSNLLRNMVLEWEDGINTIYYNVSEFDKIVELYYSNNTSVIGCYKRVLDRLKSEKRDSEKVNYYFLDVINTINPYVEKIYWDGNSYSESYFASLVLYPLIRHINQNSLEAKKDALIRQINNMAEKPQKKSIQIDVFMLAECSILSHYYELKKDDKGKDLSLKFEAAINELKVTVDSSEDSISARLYKTVNMASLELIEHMKGTITYLLPLISSDSNNLTIFNSIDDFKYFIDEYIKEHPIEQSAKLIKIINNDDNFKYFQNR
ncbi:hypothetical protein [Pseudobutyrivibrio ruminis]|uniref:hypothetical protein n=1 Tax=Pseudobutyrivibrio ruminis TaxID=46206 RepID=UPI00051ADF86|nr:hypothetical protein [Pseudobutyrivibrio ruminis]